MNNSYSGYNPDDYNLKIAGYSGNQEIIVTCPNPEHNDSNPSACFNTTTGLLYCFSCGYSANIYQLAKQAGVTVNKTPMFLPRNADSEQLWKEFYKLPLAYDNWYLKSRQVDNAIVKQFNIRQSNQGIVFLDQIHKDFCQMRKYTGKPKYLTFGKRKLFDIYQLVTRYEPTKPLFLTEGVFGMIRGFQSGMNTLATCGAMITEQMLTPIQYVRNIYGVFDNDDSGLIASIRLLKFLPHAKIILGATADEMSLNEWSDIQKNYLTTSNVLDIIKLSTNKEKVKGFI